MSKSVMCSMFVFNCLRLFFFYFVALHTERVDLPRRVNDHIRASNARTELIAMFQKDERKKSISVKFGCKLHTHHIVNSFYCVVICFSTSYPSARASTSIKFIVNLLAMARRLSQDHSITLFITVVSQFRSLNIFDSNSLCAYIHCIE